MGLKIFLAVAAALTVLILCRIRLVAEYDDDFRFKVKYLFFSFKINLKPGQKKKKTEKEVEKTKAAQPKPKPDIKRILGMLDEYSALLKKLISDVRRHLRVDDLHMRLVVNECDAAQTAVLYGKACAAVYPGFAAIAALVNVRRSEIDVVPDFSGDGTGDFAFGCTISMRVASGIGLAIKMLVGFVKINIKKIGKNKQMRTTKDGAGQ